MTSYHKPVISPDWWKGSSQKENRAEKPHTHKTHKIHMSKREDDIGRMRGVSPIFFLVFLGTMIFEGRTGRKKNTS
jgi:hypothetical protein